MLAPQLHLQSLQKKRAAPSWTYHATGFTATQRLERDGGLTGIADGNAWTVSFWFKMTGRDNLQNYLLFFGDQTVTNPFWVERSSSNNWQVVGKTTGFATIFLITSQSTFTTSGAAWHHFFCSGNGTTFNLTIDGTNDKSGSSVEGSGNVPFTYTGTSPAADWCIGEATDATQPLDAIISEFWFNNSYISSPSAFIDSGHPANLGSDGSTGTGVTPKMYMHNPYNSFGTNSGSGGDFTVKTGTLVDQDADKP